MNELLNNNIIAVSFDDDRSAYKALTELKELDAQGRVEVQEAVVVVRTDDGRLVEKDRAESAQLENTAGGGLIGLLIGVLGGPFGVLIGGATGLMVGSLFDLDEMDQIESGLGVISSNVKPGRTALLAVVTERSVDVLDTAISEEGGTIVRRPVTEVQAEIAVAENAARKAKQEARKELVRARRDQTKESAQAKVEELKGKLPGKRQAAAV